MRDAGCHGCQRHCCLVGTCWLLWLPCEVVGQRVADDGSQWLPVAATGFELGIELWGEADRHAVLVGHVRSLYNVALSDTWPMWVRS